MRELLHFAHGNGFPSGCYRQLFLHLQTRFKCCYIDRVGHTAKFPVTENWHYLVCEVIASIKAQASRPVIGVGHSLGGILTLLAAIEEPSLFRAIVLLDSPLIGPFKSNMVRVVKALGMIDRVTPAFRSRVRQQHWHSREDAWTYLKSKALFTHFTDACLNDYIDYGMEKDEKGYKLRFDREIETRIYRTIPHILPQYEGQLTVPTTLIYARLSTVIDRYDVQYMKKQYGIVNVVTHGTHMFPMENPGKTAALIMKAVDKIT